MTKYRLEVYYQDGWYWRLYEFSEYGYYYREVQGANRLYGFKWTAILGGRLAARKRKTPYTKEFTI